jgi:long-chain acyl-CoA synthetase
VIVTAAGLNIHPEDVETVLDQQMGVRASAVVPVVMLGGTEAMAILLFRGTEVEAAQAVRETNAVLAEYQHVRYWRVWPELDFPRTSTGKIQRRKIVQWANAHVLSEQSVTGENGDALVALIARIARISATNVSDDARLDEDFHLDSLGRVQLQSELEQRMGVMLDDATLAHIATLGELRQQLGLLGHTAHTSGQHISVPAAPLHQETQEKAIYPRWPWSLPMQLVRMLFIECVMRPLVWILGAPRVEHNRDITWPEKPVLIIANHVTAYDGALVLYALPGKMRRHVAIAMAANILDDFHRARGQGSWFLNALAPAAYWLTTALFNVFPLPSTAGFRDSFAHMGKALDRGYNILIFPEGHRTSGELQQFRSGIGLLVQESNADVLPVALQGLGTLKQSGERWFRSGKLSIRVGQLMRIDTHLPAEEITTALESTLRKMLE